MIRSAILILFFFSFSRASWSEEKMIQQVENYFNKIETLQSDFTQLNPDQSLYKGKFYLKRPGKFRFDYKTPSHYLIVSDGKTLVTYDYDMDNPAYIPLSSLPVAVLFDKPLHLQDKMIVLDTQDQKDHLSLTLRLKENTGGEKILLHFSKKPFELKSWIIYHPENGITKVELIHLQKNIKFNDEKTLFRFNENVF